MVSTIIAYQSPERSGPVVQPKAGRKGRRGGPEREAGAIVQATAERGGAKWKGWRGVYRRFSCFSVFCCKIC